MHAVAPPSPGRDDLALVEKGVGNRDGLVEQTARIVAQVDDDADHGVADLFLQRVQLTLEFLFGLLTELVDADVGDIALEVAADRADLDDRTGDRDVEILIDVGPMDGEHDVCSDQPAHAVDRLGQRKAEHLLAVEMGDQVTRLQPGLESRRVVDRRHDLDEAVPW